MATRPMTSADVGRVAVMMRSLWPKADSIDVFDQGQVFVWEGEDGALGGFVAVSIRPWVDGSDSVPCPHVEGWYVEPKLRRRGIDAALIKAAETWAAAQGFVELTSDVIVSNTVSLRAHRRFGFEPTERIQYFKKALRPLPAR